MAMTTDDFFKRRTWQATIEKHNGNQDSLGAPTYENDDDWNVIVSGWPCELRTVSGGETIRGRTVSAKTTHVLLGDYMTAQTAGLGPDCRALIDAKRYSITKLWEPDGLNSQLFIEATLSW